jgi:hypothetical protein|nr:MAG TPA: tail connector protein [Caudoviricetes sp.]
MRTNIEKIASDLGPNYKDTDKEIIEEIYEEINSIASNISGLKKEDTRLYPLVKEAVKATYIARGAEGLASRGEGGMSSTFNSIIDKLKKDIISNNLRRLQ